MPPIRSAPPRIAPKPATPAKAAPAQAAATTPPASAGWTPAAGANRSIAETFSAAKSTLGKLGSSGSELQKLLEKQIPTQKELQASITAFSELAERMSPEDRKTVEKAVCLQLTGRTVSDRLQQDFEKMLNDLNNKKG